jgi:hypothetical protein
MILHCLQLSIAGSMLCSLASQQWHAVCSCIRSEFEAAVALLVFGVALLLLTDQLNHLCCCNVDSRCRYNAKCDTPSWQHPRDASPQRLLLDDPDPYQRVSAIDGSVQQYAISVRITTARNIAGVRLAPTMTLGDRQRVSRQLHNNYITT